MTLTVHPVSNRLLQAENSRDAIHLRIAGMPNDEESPHDELNWITEGRHYGWPYCYDNGTSSPEFPQADCKQYENPVLLLPAHAAPLGMTYYFAKAFSAEYAGALLIAYHGYRKYGHRIIAIPADRDGMPRAAPRDLVSNWGARTGQRMGSPVDVKAGADGAVYISEDRNGTVLRLQYGE